MGLSIAQFRCFKQLHIAGTHDIAKPTNAQPEGASLLADVLAVFPTPILSLTAEHLLTTVITVIVSGNDGAVVRSLRRQR